MTHPKVFVLRDPGSTTYVAAVEPPKSWVCASIWKDANAVGTSPKRRSS